MKPVLRNFQFAAIAAENYMRRAGLLHAARFEESYIRNVIRTDDGGPIRVSNIPIGPVARASIGTDAVMVAGTVYCVEINLPRTMTVTGIGVLNGTIVGTDNLIVSLYGPEGGFLASSALAGTLSAGADAFQQIALTVPLVLKNDGRYWVGVQCNGTTAATQRIAANAYLNLAGSFAGTFGTLPDIVPPTTFTADMGPIVYLY